MRERNNNGDYQIPIFLWFDNQAGEAVSYYQSVFKNVKVGRSTKYTEVGQEQHGQEPGSPMTIEFEIAEQPFIALNGGPVFRFSPAISFYFSCETAEEIDQLWEKLEHQGKVMMPLDRYPFSEKYGWLQDRYGISWQFILANDRQHIRPCLLFVGEQHGNAKKAMELYTSIFEDAGIDETYPYEEGDGGGKGTLKHAKFHLRGKGFVAMDSHLNHQFSFTEAVSFVVECQSQEQLDYFWKALSEGGNPQAQQCGWLKDRFGVSWQIVPDVLKELLSDPNESKTKAVTKAMFQMKKLSIPELQKAYESA